MPCPRTPTVVTPGAARYGYRVVDTQHPGALLVDLVLGDTEEDVGALVGELVAALRPAYEITAIHDLAALERAAAEA